MMRDGIGHQADIAFRGNLLHNLGFSDARRPHQQNRTLPDLRNPVRPEFVLCQIRLDRIPDLLFRAFDVHLFFLLCLSCA